MDSLSHSRQPSKSSAALSKKVCNGSGNLMSRTTYDDVFGGPPKFGAPTLAPRLEDYSEIFGGFHAPRPMSIPVLDLPSLDEEEVFFDVRSSSFDYNEVFGGFDDLDFAVSIDELVMGPSNGVDGDLNSSEEAWTPLETESVSEVSDHSGRNRSFSNRDSFDSIDGHMEFNISYNRANQRSDEDLSTGITHVTQLDAVPAYTFLVDKTTPLKRTDNDSPPLEVTDDDNIHMEFSGGSVKEKNLQKTMSQQSNGSSIEQTLGNCHRTKREYGRNSSLPKESFITISEISLRTVPSELPPPRRPPPLVDTKKGETTRVDKNGKTTSSDGSNGDTSPPFFDVEVDMSSSAAASAAAMKEAMDKAEVKLKSAKEQLERKRECVQSRKTGRKDKDEKLAGNIGGTSYINGDREHATCAKKESGMESSIREERLKVRRKTKVVSESLDGEKLFDLSQTLAENRRQSEEMETDEWKQATQFFELVRNDRSLKASGPADDDEILMSDTKDHRCRQKERGAENEKKSKVAKELLEQHEISASETSKASYQHKGLEKQVKVSQEVCEQRGYENNFRAAQYPEEIEKEADGANVSGPFENWVKVSSVEYEKPMKHHEKEQPVDVPVKSMEQKFKISRDKEDSEKKQRKSLAHNENGTKHKETLVQVENDKKLKEEKERKERRSKEILEWEENFKRQKEAQEREEVEKRTREALKQTQNEKRLKEVGEKKQGETIYLEENERVLKEAREQEDSDKMQKDAWEREENENRLNEADQNEENEENQRVAHKREQTENGQKKTREVGKMDRRLNDINEKEESRKRLEAACDERYNSKMLKEVKEREECDMASEKCFGKQMKHASEESRVHTEKKLEDAGNDEDLKRLNKARRKRWGEENWKGLKMAEGPQVHSEEEELHARDETSMLDGDQNLDETKLGCQHENHERVPGSEGTYHKENGRIQTEPIDSDIESEAAKTTCVRDDETSELSGLAEDNLEHDEDRVQLEDDVEIHCPDGSVKTRGDLGIDIELDKTNSASHMASDKMNTGKKFAAEHGEGEGNIKHAQPNLNQKENKDKVMQTRVTKDIQNGRKTDDAQPSVLGGKRNTKETAQWENVTKNADRKENNISVKLTSEQREAERIKREKELEAERLRKMEEEWEREREREKDRMAVDRATLEARERTFSEARERAEKAAFERATAEARNRAMTEARERLEKACAEAREKSLADKASMEAKLRAERAAVERATAEARERAIEKVMAERAAFEAKERLERTFSEKFSASSRNNSMRPSSSSSDQQDKKFQNSASFNDSRYHYSSAYDASYNAERNNGVEGESAQRCKARLERHRRTAERAAKALAEKNMRDLLAQREQAERNRLAETLDADVKRWSSGKEGNLRALLSTLQYILGPESGWHPIPLTEVITSAAVKKAYRKATLCVHPDKLQQRGATIQQKYISEKVFDLLKEAWNKFNSEER